MFALYFADIGTNRLGIIKTLAHVLEVTLAEAKQIVDTPDQRVAVGDAQRIAYVRRQLQAMGAKMVVEYCPEAMNPKSWLTPQLSADGVTCAKCGATLFFAIPGLTTGEGIAEFARQCGDSQVASDRWIHPGVYCPNGCGFVMVNLEHPDKYTGENP